MQKRETHKRNSPCQKKKIKKKYHNKTKTQPFSVSEGIHFFSSPDDIHTQEKKKDDIIIIVGFLKEINRKPSPSHRAFAQQQQQHPFYSFPSPWTQHTYRHRLENVFFFFSCWPATAGPSLCNISFFLPFFYILFLFSTPCHTKMMRTQNSNQFSVFSLVFLSLNVFSPFLF